MTAKTITFGISKGGCSKTTTAGIVAYSLSQAGNKVLAVDMDSQGNLTAMLTGEYDICKTFSEKTVLEAILKKDIRPYVLAVNEYLHIVPSNDYLVQLSRYVGAGKVKMTDLETALAPVMDLYDYIIFDCPPSLSEQTIMPLTVRSKVGSYTVIMFDASEFCYFAIQKYLDIVQGVKDRFNPNIVPVGICFNIVSGQAKELTEMIEKVDKNFPNMRFEKIIQRRAATKRLAKYGFENNKELKSALQDYDEFLKELLQRVK